MPRPFRFLRTFTQTRRTLRALEQIALAQTEQTHLLRRLTDRLAPEEKVSSAEDLRTTGPSFSRDAEQAKMLEFIDKTYRSTGREPSEDEVIAYLDGQAV